VRFLDRTERELGDGGLPDPSRRLLANRDDRSRSQETEVGAEPDRSVASETVASMPNDAVNDPARSATVGGQRVPWGGQA
jgi:hypothetical protein